LSLGAGVRCQLAVEEHMACGLGTCIGCAIETVDPDTGEGGYSLVCTDGPVFRAERLRWLT
jgi:dihydroorotate dehydrogenase electron transfer subunit